MQSYFWRITELSLIWVSSDLTKRFCITTVLLGLSLSLILWTGQRSFPIYPSIRASLSSGIWLSSCALVYLPLHSFQRKLKVSDSFFPWSLLPVLSSFGISSFDLTFSPKMVGGGLSLVGSGSHVSLFSIILGKYRFSWSCQCHPVRFMFSVK